MPCLKKVCATIVPIHRLECITERRCVGNTNTALNNGAKLHHVAHALGHKSIGMTSIYTRGTLSTEDAPSSFLLKNKVIVQEAPMLLV